MDSKRLGMVAALGMLAAGATMGGAEVLPRLDVKTAPMLPKGWGYRRRGSHGRIRQGGNPAGTKIANKAAAGSLTKRC